MKDFDPLQMLRMIAEAFYSFSNDRVERRRFHIFTAVLFGAALVLLTLRLFV